VITERNRIDTVLSSQAIPFVVLDSNIWLDILIFDDPRTRPIHAALISGKLVAWTDSRCYGELARVLDYPQFSQFKFCREEALAWVQAHSRWFDGEKCDHATALPQCSDLDDQKFLELARDCQANFLISKDKAVLKLASRMQKDCNVSVLLPEVFCRIHSLDLNIKNVIVDNQ